MSYVPFRRAFGALGMHRDAGGVPWFDDWEREDVLAVIKTAKVLGQRLAPDKILAYAPEATTFAFQKGKGDGTEALEWMQRNLDAGRFVATGRPFEPIWDTEGGAETLPQLLSASSNNQAIMNKMAQQDNLVMLAWPGDRVTPSKYEKAIVIGAASVSVVALIWLVSR